MSDTTATYDPQNAYIRTLERLLILATNLGSTVDRKENAELMSRVDAELGAAGDCIAHPDSKDAETMAMMLCESLAGLCHQMRAAGATLVVVDYDEPEWDKLKVDCVLAGSNLNDTELLLAERRRDLDAKIEIIKQQFEKTNAEMIQSVEEYRQASERAQAELRAAMLEDFAVNNEKQVHQGLSIRINKGYRYSDKDAVAFAIDRKMPELLKPDATAFKKQMALTPQEFCTVTETAVTAVSLK